MEVTILNQPNEVKIPNSGYATKEELRATEAAIVSEIMELEDVKGCLNHFLASHNSMLYPATAVEAKVQVAFVWENLKELYAELKEVRAMLEPKVYAPRVINLMHNEQEIEAIMLFNSDRRFTINE